MKRRELLTGLIAAVLAGDRAGEALRRVGHPAPSEQVASPARAVVAGTHVNMGQFKATGNGSTDDTAALTSARDAAGANGTVTVPPGTYVLNNLTLNVPGQNWRIMRGATLLLKPATAAPLLRVTADGVTIEGPGTLDGNLANQAGGNIDAGVEVTSADNVTFRGLIARNLNGYGIYFNGGCNNGTVDDCTITNTWNQAVCYSTVGADYTGATVTRNRIDNSGRGATSVGGCIAVVTSGRHRARRSLIADNVLVAYPSYWGEAPDVSAGIQLQQAEGFTVSGNSIRDCSFGITLPDSLNGVISSNYIEAWSVNAIEVSGCSNLSIAGNTMIDTNPRGRGGHPASPVIPVLWPVSRYVTATGNTIVQVTPDVVTIMIGGGGPNPAVGNVVFRGNVIRKSGGGTAIDVSGDASYVTIDGNIIDCNGTASNVIWLETFDFYGTAKGRVITGNTIRDYAHGSAIVHGTEGTSADIDYVTIQGNVFQAGSKGITQSGTGGWGRHSSIANNTGP
jgi:parallel beta-helix repeat protein